MTGKEYAKELQKLQVELCRLQDWVTATGQRIIVLFEGRDVGSSKKPNVHATLYGTLSCCG
jgi:polyphosphate kinase 2 (PPK2 family)